MECSRMHLFQGFGQFAASMVILVAVVLGRTSVDASLVNIQYNTNVMPIIDKHLN